MAEVFRIEIPIEVQDQTEPAISRAQQRVTAFERTARRTEEQLNRMNRTRWQLTLTALDRASAVIGRVSNSVASLTRRTWQISIGVAGSPFRALNWIWSRLTSIQGLATAFFAGQAFRGGVLWPLQVSGQLQQAQIGFTTFLGSAQKAQEFMQRLQRFGAETPFEMDQLTRLGTQLLPAFRGNVDMVFRTLRAFGDAAALTGAGINGMELALLGFRQIAAKGRLSMEELLQVTENLMIPMEPIIQELGITQKQLQNLGSAGIPAARAMEAILRALERPVARGGFAGGMAVQMQTLSGQASMLRDTVMQNLIQPWGRGLLSVVVPALQRVNEWFGRNREMVGRWGQALEQAARDAGMAVVGWFERGFARLRRLMDDPRWQKADFYGKVSLAWDELIAKPFNKWWEEGGRDWAVEVGGKIARALWSGFKRTSEVLLRAAWNELKQLFREHPFLTTGAIGAGLLVAVAKVGALVRDVKSLVDVFRGTPRACGCPPDQPPFTRVPMAPTSAPPVPVPGGGRGIGGALVRAVPLVGAGVLGASLGYFGARWVDQHILEPLARRREQEFERRVREAPWNRPTEVARELGLNDPARISLRAAQPTLWERISRFFSAPRAYAAPAPVTPRPAIGMGDLRRIDRVETTAPVARAVENTVNVHSGAVQISITIEGGDPNQVVETIERNARRVARVLADETALEIARRARQVQANMPLAPRGRFGPALDPR